MKGKLLFKTIFFFAFIFCFKTVKTQETTPSPTPSVNSSESPITPSPTTLSSTTPSPTTPTPTVPPKEACTDFKEVVGCVCFQQTKQIRCENSTINATTLNGIGQNVVGNFDLLYIRNVSTLQTINENTFIMGTFARVFIELNENLTAINDGAINLANTRSLFVTNNTKLADGIEKLIEKSSNVLQFVDFRGNKIAKASTNLFHDKSKVGNIQYIRMDNQNLEDPNQFTVNKDAFKDLTSLKQLSLDNKKIKLDNGSIDLSGTTTLAGEHVEVFLANSGLEGWNKNVLVISDSVNVWLDLIGNPLKNLTLSEYDDFLKTNNNNKLFVKLQFNECDCGLVNKYKSEPRVNGLICDNFEECTI